MSSVFLYLVLLSTYFVIYNITKTNYVNKKNYLPIKYICCIYYVHGTYVYPNIYELPLHVLSACFFFICQHRCSWGVGIKYSYVLLSNSVISVTRLIPPKTKNIFCIEYCSWQMFSAVVSRSVTLCRSMKFLRDQAVRHFPKLPYF